MLIVSTNTPYPTCLTRKRYVKQRNITSLRLAKSSLVHRHGVLCNLLIPCVSTQYVQAGHGFVIKLYIKSVSTLYFLCFQGESEHINLKVLGQDNAIVQFKIKKHTPLRKLMNAYCDRAVCFLLTFSPSLCLLT